MSTNNVCCLWPDSGSHSIRYLHNLLAGPVYKVAIRWREWWFQWYDPSLAFLLNVKDFSRRLTPPVYFLILMFRHKGWSHQTTTIVTLVKVNRGNPCEERNVFGNGYLDYGYFNYSVITSITLRSVTHLKNCWKKQVSSPRSCGRLSYSFLLACWEITPYISLFNFTGWVEISNVLVK